MHRRKATPLELSASERSNRNHGRQRSESQSCSRYDVGALNAYDLAANRASSSFDIRHRLNIGYVYALPFFKSSAKMHTFLGEWPLSGITTFQTGTPFSPINGSSYSDNPGSGNPSSITAGSYVDLIGGPTANIPSVSMAAPTTRPAIPVVWAPAHSCISGLRIRRASCSLERNSSFTSRGRNSD